MADTPAQAAEEELRRWAETNARRDGLVRDAVTAGVKISRIQQITGISRADIMRILAHAPKRPVLRLVGRD
jgi:hypothetical protein